MNEDITEASEADKDRIVKNAGQLLHFLVTNIPNKIRMAELRRSALRASLQRGENPKGDPRLEFIHKSSSNIFGWLAARSKEFDAENPHDICTVNDLLDILTMAQRKLMKKIKDDLEASEAPRAPTSAS